jgi:hypothetical protein
MAKALIKSPKELLSFWFSEEAYLDQPELLSSSAFMRGKMQAQWYAGTKADESCMPFVATIEGKPSTLEP